MRPSTLQGPGPRQGVPAHSLIHTHTHTHTLTHSAGAPGGFPRARLPEARWAWAVACAVASGGEALRRGKSVAFRASCSEAAGETGGAAVAWGGRSAVTTLTCKTSGKRFCLRP